MTALGITSFTIFFIYLIFILIKFHTIPQSLSDSFYMLGGNLKKYLFTGVLFTMVFTILPCMIEVTPDILKFMAFLCPAGIGFVGAAPFFKDGEWAVHSTSAIISAIFGLLWVIFCTPYWYFIVEYTILMTILALCTKTIKSSKTWWLEMIVFFSVYSALIFSLINLHI